MSIELHRNTRGGTENARPSSQVQRILLRPGSEEEPEIYKLSVLHALGFGFFKLGYLEQAEFLLRHAAEGRKEILGLTNMDTRNSLQCLGALYYSRNKFFEVKKLFRQLFLL